MPRGITELNTRRAFTLAECAFVVDSICAYFQVSKEMLSVHGNSRRPPHLLAKQAIIYVAWTSYSTTHKIIADRLGISIPKSGVNHMITITENDRADKPEFDRFLTELEDSIIQRRIQNNADTNT